MNSLRSPASANSLFSCRPTRGLISRAGIIPISYTQDAIGPIARTVKDVATALTVMASVGYDPDDNTTALIPPSSVNVDYAAAMSQVSSLSGMRFGLIEGFFNRTASNETTPVNDAMDAIVSTLTSAGATVVTINDTTTYNATAQSANFDVQQYEYRQELSDYLADPSLGGVHPKSMPELYASGKFLVIPSQYAYVNNALVSSTDNNTVGGNYATTKLGIQNLTSALQSTFTANNLDAVIYPEQKNLVVKVGAPSQAGRNGILGAVTGSAVVTIPIGFSRPDDSAPIGVRLRLTIVYRPSSRTQRIYQARILSENYRPAVFYEHLRLYRLLLLDIVTFLCWMAPRDSYRCGTLNVARPRLMILTTPSPRINPLAKTITGVSSLRR